MISGIKRIFFLLTLIIVFFIIFKFNLLNIGSTFSLSHVEEKNSTIITEKIERLCNLSTVKYTYQEIVDYSDTMKFGETELPFAIGGKKIILTYRAYINGGCQFIKLEEVSEEHVKIYLSKGQILDNVLVLESVNIYDVQQGIFNKFNLGDDTSLINDDMKKYAEANKTEIISNAERNTAELIQSFLETLGYINTEIIFQKTEGQ